MNKLLMSILKTGVAAAVGAIAPAVLSLIDHPSGGTLVAMQHNPVYAEVWGLGALFAHNAYDHFFGSAPSK